MVQVNMIPSYCKQKKQSLKIVKEEGEEKRMVMVKGKEERERNGKKLETKKKESELTV